MARDIIPRAEFPLADRLSLRQYYGRKRGHADGWEEEFDRSSNQALNKLRQQREADTADAEALHAEISGLWPTFDPDHPRHVMRLDHLLEKLRDNPASVFNPEINEIARVRAEQREEARRERKKELSERSQEYTPRVRPGLRVHYDVFAPMFRIGWGDSIYD
jgi:hypothetical protein